MCVGRMAMRLHPRLAADVTGLLELQHWSLLLAVCGSADTTTLCYDVPEAQGVAMCLLPWLQRLCAVPVLRTLTGDLLLQSTDGELTTLQHNCTVC